MHTHLHTHTHTRAQPGICIILLSNVADAEQTEVVCHNHVNNLHTFLLVDVLQSDKQIGWAGVVLSDQRPGASLNIENLECSRSVVA